MSKDDQQKRDGFIPLGDVAGAVELPGGRALTPAAPKARHHFTTLQQVNQLVEASEAEPDLGFMARLLALCSLPRTNPRDRQEYVRRNGPHVLILSAGGWPKRLPFGNLPRLLLAWVCSEAVRTQRRDLVLGRSLYEFMRKLGLEDRSGGRHGERARLKNQMRRLFSCSVQLVYADGDHEVLVSSFVAERAEFWWTMKRPEAPVLWDSTIRLGEEFFNEIIAHPIPLDMNILRSLKRSPLGLDLYLLARVSHLHAQGSIDPLVEAALSAVQRGPAQSQQPRLGEHVPRGLSARVEENQTRLAEAALWDGHGRAHDLAVAAAHPAGTASTYQRLGHCAS